MEPESSPVISDDLRRTVQANLISVNSIMLPCLFFMMRLFLQINNKGHLLNCAADITCRSNFG